MNFAREVDLEPYNGTFHDYAEAVLQFGYVNLFSAVSECCLLLFTCMFLCYFRFTIVLPYFFSAIFVNCFDNLISYVIICIRYVNPQNEECKFLYYILVLHSVHTRYSSILRQLKK